MQVSIHKWTPAMRDWFNSLRRGRYDTEAVNDLLRRQYLVQAEIESHFSYLEMFDVKQRALIAESIFGLDLDAWGIKMLPAIVAVEADRLDLYRKYNVDRGQINALLRDLDYLQLCVVYDRAKAV